MRVKELIRKLELVLAFRGDIEVFCLDDGIPFYVEKAKVLDASKEAKPGDEYYMPEHVILGGDKMVWPYEEDETKRGLHHGEKKETG